MARAANEEHHTVQFPSVARNNSVSSLCLTLQEQRYGDRHSFVRLPTMARNGSPSHTPVKEHTKQNSLLEQGDSHRTTA